LSFADSEVATDSFADYRIARFHDVVRDVTFLPAQELPSTGVGEPGSVPVAAAIANALVDACGVRVRRLPMTSKAIASATT
jgi:CO/xanthine dehydrogenase Mo-binding subunit